MTVADDRAPEGAPDGVDRHAPLPGGVRALLASVATDRSAALALHSVIAAADPDGVAPLAEVARRYRDDHVAARRQDGADADREAGRLSLDEVRLHLTTSVLPRLASEGLLSLDPPIGEPTAVRVTPANWAEIRPVREQVATAFQHTGEHRVVPTPVAGVAVGSPGESRLSASGLVKIYRSRRVVNDVALRLQQGEIVGLLGPNGAGKTTTFYMIVGLIAPHSGRITLDGRDITDMPMYQRARQGIGYLSQEPSIFRKLSVEDNILAILETLDLRRQERAERLESLLDELQHQAPAEEQGVPALGRRAAPARDHPRARHAIRSS